MPSRAMERDQIPSLEILELANEVGWLLEQIEELDCAISRDMDTLGRAKAR